MRPKKHSKLIVAAATISDFTVSPIRFDVRCPSFKAKNRVYGFVITSNEWLMVTVPETGRRQRRS